MPTYSFNIHPHPQTALNRDRALVFRADFDTVEEAYAHGVAGTINRMQRYGTLFIFELNEMSRVAVTNPLSTLMHDPHDLTAGEYVRPASIPTYGELSRELVHQVQAQIDLFIDALVSGTAERLINYTSDATGPISALLKEAIRDGILTAPECEHCSTCDCDCHHRYEEPPAPKPGIYEDGYRIAHPSRGKRSSVPPIQNEGNHK